MAIAGMSDKERLKWAQSTLKEMETLAARMRDLIAAQPARDLLGYIYSKRMIGGMQQEKGHAAPDSDAETKSERDLIGDTQFVLEYVHAVLSSTSKFRNCDIG